MQFTQDSGQARHADPWERKCPGKHFEQLVGEVPCMQSACKLAHDFAWVRKYPEAHTLQESLLEHVRQFSAQESQTPKALQKYVGAQGYFPGTQLLLREAPLQTPEEHTRRSTVGLEPQYALPREQLEPMYTARIARMSREKKAGRISGKDYYVYWLRGAQ